MSRPSFPTSPAGIPAIGRFADALLARSRISEAVEIGIPFCDPMADGATIQESSRVALENGATLDSILVAIEGLGRLDAHLVVMSYLNPLLAYGLGHCCRDWQGLACRRWSFRICRWRKPKSSPVSAAGTGSVWCNWSVR